ncbi:MAG: CobW family GTP-binding protein [Lachnospiraceae bacterium]|jgi:G3E family GTPase
MTKIDIISGFLGAGKTTLIKKLLKESFAGQQIVLIENEFGEIGIDGGFLKDAGVKITEMNSGCICCTLVGDFNKALKQVVADYHPDRILIEPSGVGKLSDVIAAVAKTANEIDIRLNNFVTVADAHKCKMYMRNFGEFYNNQIESANTIILSRTQTMDEKKLQEAVTLLQEKNPKARIITTPWDELTGDQILAVMEQGQSLTDELLKEALEKHEKDAAEHEAEHHHHDHDVDEHHDDHDEHEHGHEDHDEAEHHHHDHDEEDRGEDEHGHHDHEEDEHHHDGEGHEHHHHHHADEIFDSWGKETPKKFGRGELENILKTLSESGDYGTVLRAKGMLPCTDGKWMYFDLTPDEYEIRDGQPDYTGRLCVIGAGLKQDKLRELFGL